jgi:glycosyltransferase involved in cell wall biosynthesis
MEPYLMRCIESLRKQTVKNADLEFVFVNDGSVDGTLSMLKKYEKQDNRVVVIDQPNSGVCAARNHGLEKARGEYVFFLDGDDWMTDDASEVMYGFCKDSFPDIAIFSNYKVYENNPNERYVWVDCAKFIKEGVYNTATYIMESSYIPISFKLYKREFLISNRIFFDSNLHVGEVFTFFVHALTLSKTVGVSGKYVMNYLKREGKSATTEVNVERDLSALETLHIISHYVEKNHSDLMYNRALLCPLFFMITAFTVIKYIGRGEYTKEKGKLISIARKDPYYRKLLQYFLTTGFSLNKYTAMAATISFFPSKVTYNIFRKYYQHAKGEKN